MRYELTKLAGEWVIVDNKADRSVRRGPFKTKAEAEVAYIAVSERKGCLYGCDCLSCTEERGKHPQGFVHTSPVPYFSRSAKSRMPKIKARKPFPGQMDLFDDRGGLNVIDPDTD